MDWKLYFKCMAIVFLTFSAIVSVIALAAWALTFTYGPFIVFGVLVVAAWACMACLVYDAKQRDRIRTRHIVQKGSD